MSDSESTATEQDVALSDTGAEARKSPTSTLKPDKERSPATAAWRLPRRLGGESIAATSEAAIVTPSANKFKGRRVSRLSADGTSMENGHVRTYLPAEGETAEAWVVDWDDNAEIPSVLSKDEFEKAKSLQDDKDKMLKESQRVRKKKNGFSSGKSGGEKVLRKGSAPPTTLSHKPRSPGTAILPLTDNGSSRPGKRGRPVSSKAHAGGTKVRATAKARATRGMAEETQRKIQGSEADKGILVAKFFPKHGLFTGRVTKLQVTENETLWTIEYEDGDSEDLVRSELDIVRSLYLHLLRKVKDQKGTSFPLPQDTGKDEEEEEELDLAGDDSNKIANEEASASKRRAKVTRGEFGRRLVGKRVRKDFGEHGQFDGEVAKFLPAEDRNDEDLWRISYTDGDSEDMNKDEVMAAMRTYSEHFSLIKTSITLSRQDAPFAEQLAAFTAKENEGKGGRVEHAEEEWEKDGKSLDIDLFAERKKARLFGTLTGCMYQAT